MVSEAEKGVPRRFCAHCDMRIMYAKKVGRTLRFAIKPGDGEWYTFDRDGNYWRRQCSRSPDLAHHPKKGADDE